MQQAVYRDVGKFLRKIWRHIPERSHSCRRENLKFHRHVQKVWYHLRTWKTVTLRHYCTPNLILLYLIYSVLSVHCIIELFLVCRWTYNGVARRKGECTGDATSTLSLVSKGSDETQRPPFLIPLGLHPFCFCHYKTIKTCKKSTI